MSEDDARTWTGKRGPGETLTTQLFAERGGTSVVSDTAGNVYLAGDRVDVYDATDIQPACSKRRSGRAASASEAKTERRCSWARAESLYAIAVAAAGK